MHWDYMPEALKLSTEVARVPLTPALSRRERENRRPPARKAGASSHTSMRTWTFPLPTGEGQGEGKGTLQTIGIRTVCRHRLIENHEPHTRLRGDHVVGLGLGLRLRVRHQGFTLIELMVVIVIIGIMSAMIIPEISGSYEAALLRSTSRTLVEVFNIAYSRAITTGHTHLVRLDSKQGRYRLEREAQEGEEGRGFSPLHDISGGEGEIDKRITIQCHRAEAETQAMIPGSVPEEMGKRDPSEAISFYADGTADAVEVLLRDRQGFRLALKINPVTARVHINELERE